MLFNYRLTVLHVTNDKQTKLVNLDQMILSSVHGHRDDKSRTLICRAVLEAGSQVQLSPYSRHTTVVTLHVTDETVKQYKNYKSIIRHSALW